MERRARRRPLGGLEVPVRTQADGPVCPTGAALGRLRPLGLLEVALDEGWALGDWQRRNSADTLPHCVEQVRRRGRSGIWSGWLRGSAAGLHEGMPFSDSDVYKVVEAPPGIVSAGLRVWCRSLSRRSAA